jgi:hypothetical protein
MPLLTILAKQMVLAAVADKFLNNGNKSGCFNVKTTLRCSFVISTLILGLFLFI